MLIFPAGDFAAIGLKRGMQAGSKLYYQIELSTRSGKKHTLASRITDQRLAMRLIKDLESAMTA